MSHSAFRLIASRDEPAAMRGADILRATRDHPADAAPQAGGKDNVIRLGRPLPSGSDAPPLAIDPAARPAPSWPDRRRRGLIGLLALSLAAHAALYAVADRKPRPLASVGLESVSVDIVLGGRTEAGRSEIPSESEVAALAAPEHPEAEEVPPETARQPEPDVATAEIAVADRPDMPTPQDAARAPADATSDATAPMPPLAAHPAPSPVPAEIVAMPTPRETQKLVSAVAESAIETPRETARDDTARPRATKPPRTEGQQARNRVATASASAAPSSGIGIGRSDRDSNYRGLVAAHLARFKQYPADSRGRGEEGSASVAFALDGRGMVTAVNLTRSAGHDRLDQEAVAMVRRAAPFPPPPDGQPQSFTVPVSFTIR